MKLIYRGKVKLSDITVGFFVRTQLNQDRALHFGELIEAGVALPPIIVDKNNEAVDGRHRIEAYQLMNVEFVEVERYEYVDEAEKIEHAVSANQGGALPPSQKDIKHVVKHLINKRIPQNRFPQILGLPPSICKKLIDSVRKEEKGVSLNKAVKAVVDDDLSPQKAADVYQVPLQDLKLRLGGKKKKGSTVGEFMKEFEAFNRSAGQKMNSQLKKFAELVEDGHANSDDIKKLMTRARGKCNNWLRILDDWEKRLNQSNGG